VRGRFILDHYPLDGKRYRMTWSGITDTQEDKQIELRSPFASKLPDWKPLPTYSDYADYTEQDFSLLLEDAGSPDLDMVTTMEANEANMTLLHDRGVSSERRGMMSMAARYYQRTVEMAERIGQASMATHCRWHLASLWIHENRADQAMEVVVPILDRPDDDPEADFSIHLQSSLVVALQAAIALQEPWETIEALYQRGMAIDTRLNDSVRTRLRGLYQGAILQRSV